MTAQATSQTPRIRPDGDVEPGYTGPWSSVIAGAVLVALGTAWLLSAADIIVISAALVLPALLALLGLALVVASARGPHPGLVALGVLLSIATGFAAVAPPEALRGGFGERLHVVSTVDNLENRYELGIGDLRLDFSELELTDHRTVTVSLGAGNLDLVPPEGVPILVTAETGAGEIVLFGETTNGVALEQTYRSTDYNNADARLHIKVEVGAGSIEVNE